MQVDFLIIGQGISGTWLSYYLKKEDRSFLVIDDHDQHASSRLAAGVINPVTGRRHVEVWMAGEILPFSREAYSEMGIELGIRAISEKSIIDFFPSAQMRVSFDQRVRERSDYVFDLVPPSWFHDTFQFDFGCGEIRPVYIAHLENILPAWRSELVLNNLLLEESFEYEHLEVKNEQVRYKNIIASHIIFCDGQQSADSPYFNRLPFAPNKGEILLAEIKDLDPAHIYKKGMMMVPLEEKGLWWIGSSYQWEFEDTLPTAAFREKTEALLKSWLKVPFTITDHLAGIRPATLERRPFVGTHPAYYRIALLNGMGTKGCSLAPYFAKQLSDLLCANKPILPEADINRFRKILSGTISS